METVNYQFQILRYRHDVATGEFVNVGLVYFDKQTQFLHARMTQKTERIARFFGDIESEHLLRTFKGLENAFNQLENISAFTSVSDITKYIFPPNDNALAFSPTAKGFDVDGHYEAFDDLYFTLIGKYNGEKMEKTRPISKTKREEPQFVLV
jgi:Protein of unknown function (DUF3037)